MLNLSLKEFKKNLKKEKNLVLYFSLKQNKDKEVNNLINNFLHEKNSFVFESIEKGYIKGRYTIFGKNPDKICEFNNKSCKLIIDGKKINLKGSAKKIIENIIENFKFSTPKELPPICSLLSGYFSYDIIRYLEKIPNKNNDDLKIPDVRLIRPRNLIIQDNFKKKIYFIVNVFNDEKIKNFDLKYK